MRSRGARLTPLRSSAGLPGRHLRRHARSGLLRTRRAVQQVCRAVRGATARSPQPACGALTAHARSGCLLSVRSEANRALAKMSLKEEDCVPETEGAHTARAAGRVWRSRWRGVVIEGCCRGRARRGAARLMQRGVRVRVRRLESDGARHPEGLEGQV